MRYVLSAVAAAAVVVSCGGKNQADVKTPGDTTRVHLGATSDFIPPADGKVTPAQAEAFARAALSLQRIGESARSEQSAFFAKHSLAEEDRVRVVADTVYARLHPDLVSEYNEMESAWKSRLSAVYDSVGLDPGEFVWVGEALQTAVNSDAAQLAVNVLSGQPKP